MFVIIMGILNYCALKTTFFFSLKNEVSLE